jgi:hypothetical protein
VQEKGSEKKRYNESICSGERKGDEIESSDKEKE